jgi:hypothetical protein
MTLAPMAYDYLAQSIADYNTSPDGLARVLRSIAGLPDMTNRQRYDVLTSFMASLPPFCEGDIHPVDIAESMIRLLSGRDHFSAERFRNLTHST